jgi:DNA-damage-inducible protein J
MRTKPQAKTSYITARVEPQLKKRTSHILRGLGVSTTDAIIMFLRQVELHKGLPFEVKIPNAETVRTMRELDAGRGETFSGSTADFFTHVLGKKHKA